MTGWNACKRHWNPEKHLTSRKDFSLPSDVLWEASYALSNKPNESAVMNKEHWMGAYPELGRLRIDQLILPGTHDSGMDKQANGLSLPNEITQDVPCIEQIRGGIRVLDLRVRAYPQHAQTSALHFQLFHLNSSGRTIKEDIVDALNGFYENPDNAKEIVILDFHEFSRFDPDEHRLLQALLAELGPRMIPYSLHGLTLDELWREHPGRTVVIGYDQGRTPPEYWPSVSHRWIGKIRPVPAH